MKLLAFFTLLTLTFSVGLAQNMKIKWTDQQGREFAVSAPNGEFSFDMIQGDQISYDYSGRISRIGSVSVSYNYNNKLTSVGNVSIRYDYSGRVKQVGGCSVSYDYSGRITGTSGRVTNYSTNQYNNSNRLYSPSDYNIPRY